MTDTEILSEGRKVLLTEATAVTAMAERLDGAFVRAVGMIRETKGRVIVSGMGKSGLVGKKIAATLASTGTPAFSMHPAEAGHGDLGMVTSDDLVLLISHSGETEEILALLPYFKRFGVRIIAMTGSGASTLARSADVRLDVSVRDEACPMGIVPTASTTASMAMGDALAIALFVKRGFSEEDFACYHPKGSLGRKLLTRVRDLMHTGDAIPYVSPDTPMDRTVLEISGKRLGLALVMDGGQLAGVVTDGDLRRGIARLGRDFFDKRADEVMTREPRTVGPDELAAEALALMQQHSITALVVRAEPGGLTGIIHIHDILKAGIV